MSVFRAARLRGATGVAGLLNMERANAGRDVRDFGDKLDGQHERAARLPTFGLPVAK